MSIEKFYDSYESVRIRRSQGRAAAQAGKSAMNGVSGDLSPYIAQSSGREIAIMRRVHKSYNKSVLCLVVNIAEKDDEAIGQPYAQVIEDVGFQKIEYPLIAVNRLDYDSKDNEVVSAYQAIESALA